MELWWHSLEQGDHWFGVFQGGGAKGAAYAGALKTFVKAGQWFQEVTGASAGALTAALVAAGYHPDELAEITSELMRAVVPARSIDRALLKTAATRSITRFDADALEDSLERHLVEG